MHNEELDKLIELALADGVLSDKEKVVLFRKAKSLGVDKDEFEIILEGKLHLKQEADLKIKEKGLKCPNCGQLIQSIGNVCDYCGYVINKGVGEKSFKQLSNEIEVCLKAMHSQKSDNILLIIKENSKFFLTILFTLLSWLLALFISNWIISGFFGGLAFILTIISGILVYVKVHNGALDSSGNASTSFVKLRSTFNNLIERTTIVYGKDSKIKHLLEAYNNEFKNILVRRKKLRNIYFSLSFFGLSALGILSILLYLSLSPTPVSKKVNSLLDSGLTLKAYEYYVVKKGNVNYETNIELISKLIRNDFLLEAENAMPNVADYFEGPKLESELLTKFALKGDILSSERIYKKYKENSDYLSYGSACQLPQAMIDAYILSGNIQKAEDFMMSFTNWADINSCSLYKRIINAYLKNGNKKRARKIQAMITYEEDKIELDLLINNY